MKKVRNLLKKLTEKDEKYFVEKIRKDFSIRSEWIGSYDGGLLYKALTFDSVVKETSVLNVLNKWLERKEKELQPTRLLVSYLSNCDVFKNKSGEPMFDIASLISNATERSIKFLTIYIVIGTLNMKISELNMNNLDYYVKMTIKKIKEGE